MTWPYQDGRDPAALYLTLPRSLCQYWWSDSGLSCLISKAFSYPVKGFPCSFPCLASLLSATLHADLSSSGFVLSLMATRVVAARLVFPRFCPIVARCISHTSQFCSRFPLASARPVFDPSPELAGARLPNLPLECGRPEGQRGHVCLYRPGLVGREVIYNQQSTVFSSAVPEGIQRHRITPSDVEDTTHEVLTRQLSHGFRASDGRIPFHGARQATLSVMFARHSSSNAFSNGQ